MQDGALPHYAKNVRNWLDELFPSRWMSRRGPIERPPRSPDLTTVDVSVWGIVKEIMYAQRLDSLEELQYAIENVFLSL